MLTHLIQNTFKIFHSDVHHGILILGSDHVDSTSLSDVHDTWQQALRVWQLGADMLIITLCEVEVRRLASVRVCSFSVAKVIVLKTMHYLPPIIPVCF